MTQQRQHIRRRLSLLTTNIDAITWEAVVSRIAAWASLSERFGARLKEMVVATNGPW